MARHENLFGYFDSDTGVYNKLQDDLVSDGKKMVWWYRGAMLAALAACGAWRSEWGAPLMAVAGFLALNGLHVFIDMSNRSFALHVIDWIEFSKVQRKNSTE